MIIDGKQIKEEIINRLSVARTPKKFFAAVLVGDDLASVSFLRQKEKTANELKIDFRLYRLSDELSRDKLRHEVSRIASQKSCGGLIVQLPVPGTSDPHYILNAIPPGKDVDVLGERALGAFYAGRGIVVPPAVATVEEILSREDVVLAEKSIAMVGLGFLIGRPIAAWLMRKCRDLFLLRRGSDFGLLKRTDIVVLGAGSPELVRPDMLREDAIVIDFGYGRTDDGKLTGDFKMGSVPEALRFTPTPGGTGPILVAKLFENFYKLNRERIVRTEGIEPPTYSV